MLASSPVFGTKTRRYRHGGVYPRWRQLLRADSADVHDCKTQVAIPLAVGVDKSLNLHVKVAFAVAFAVAESVGIALDKRKSRIGVEVAQSESFAQHVAL